MSGRGGILTGQGAGHLRRAAGQVADGSNDAGQKAILQIVQIWLDRLSSIAVLTTFFASLDGVLVSFTAPYAVSGEDRIAQLSNSALAGALVFHVFSAIIAYTATFALTRYKLVDAEGKELSAKRAAPSKLYRWSKSAEAAPGPPTNPEDPSAPSQFFPGILSDPGLQLRIQEFHLFSKTSTLFLDPQSSLAAGRDGEPSPPFCMLERSYTASVWMTVTGFVLAVLGIMAYVWWQLATSVSAFTTACLGACMIAMIVAFR